MPKLDVTQLLVVPHVRVHGANMLTPMTWGFPPPTTFLGLMTALRLRLKDKGFPSDFQFTGIGIICHKSEPQVYNLGSKNHRYSLSLTRNPLEKKASGISDASYHAEGKCHFEVTLLFSVDLGEWKGKIEGEFLKEKATDIGNELQTMRIAAGQVLPMNSVPYWVPFSEDDKEKKFKRLRYRFLPGFALVSGERRSNTTWKKLKDEKSPDTPFFEAWLEQIRRYYKDESSPSEKSEEETDKLPKQKADKKTGWTVPLLVGYGSLTRLYEGGEIPNTRDLTTPFRAVEGLYSIGEWVSPHRISKPEDILWQYAEYDEVNGVYRCVNSFNG